MSVYATTPKHSKPKTPCAVCGEEAPWVVWGHALCESCAGLWHANERTTVYGMGCSDSTLPETVTAFEAFTKRWVSEQRRAMRAA